MILLRRVVKMEKARAAGQSRAPVAMVWSSAVSRIEVELADGESVATDVHITGSLGGTLTWRTAERVTRNAADRGVVYGVDGAALGHVRKIDGSYVDLDVDEAALREAAGGKNAQVGCPNKGG